MTPKGDTALNSLEFSPPLGLHPPERLLWDLKAACACCVLRFARVLLRHRVSIGKEPKSGGTFQVREPSGP